MSFESFQQPPDEWQALFSAACDGRLEKADRLALQTLLRTNDGARLSYVAYCDLHASLIWRYRESIATTTTSVSRFRSTRFIAIIASIAASIAMIVGWQAMIVRDKNSKNPLPVESLAVAVQIEDGVLRSNAFVCVSGQSMGSGHWMLDAGVAEVHMVNGVQLIIEGPASFELLSAMRVELTQGRASADVPVGAIGFTIATPQGCIVDQGTSFGVSVGDEGTTDVEVFSGRVDLMLGREVKPLAAVSLKEGESKRLVDGRFETIEEVDQTGKPQWTRELMHEGDYRELGGPTPVEPITLPKSLEPGSVADAEKFFVMCERRGVVLDRDLPAFRAVLKSEVKGHAPESARPTMISAGTKVDIFLLHYDASAGNALTRPLRYSLIRFRGRILGAVCDPEPLVETDAWLGSREVRYPNRAKPTPPKSWLFRMQETNVANKRLAGSLYFSGVGRVGEFVQIRVLVESTSL